MEAFLIYIGKVSIAAGAFYLAYLVLFQNQKHFRFNRIFLPVSMFFSFVIPLITFTTVKYVELPVYERSSAAFSSLSSMPVEYVAPAFQFEWYHYLFGLYMLGAIGFLIHLLFGHLKAIHIIRTSKIRQLFDHIINITKKDIHPFSFFNKIVLSEKTLASPDLEMIVSHEKIHVQEKHTMDILFTEIMFLFQWFNPFAWLIKSAIRDNLEYKTDDIIARKYNPQKYQLAMVALADKKEVAPFLTALNGSQLKNRIIMMKKKTENKFSVVKQLIVLPLLAVLIMGLSNKEVKTEFNQTKGKVEIIVDGKVVPSDNKNISKIDLSERIDSYDIIKALDIKNVVVNALKSDGEVPILYIRTTDYVFGTNPEFEKNTTSNIVLDKNRLTEEYGYAIDNQLVERKAFIKQGEAGFDNVVFLNGKDATEKYGEKYTIVADAKSGAPNFVIKDGTENWEGENLSLKYYDENIPAPEMERFNENMQSIMKDGIATLDPSREDFPYIILNNEEVTHKEVIKQADLKYTEVIPPKEAIKEFGEKGKNGVLIFSTKATSYEDFRSNYGSKLGKSGTTVTGKVTDKNGRPVFGVLVTIKSENISVNTDRSGNYKIYVQDADDALIFKSTGYNRQEIKVGDKKEIDVSLEYTTAGEVLFGDQKNTSEKKYNFIVKGKVTDMKGNPLSGATVLVKDKLAGTVTNQQGIFSIGIEEESETLSFHMKDFTSKEVEVTGNKEVNVKMEANPENSSETDSLLNEGSPINPDALIIVDGKVVKDLSLIQSEDIASMTVLKSATASALYGDMGKGGAIIITTQKDADNNSNKSGQKNSGDSESSNDVRNPLIIVDGMITIVSPKIDFDFKTAKIEDFGKLLNIAPENIESIEVLKGAEEIAKYGDLAKRYSEKAKNEAFVITTNKRNKVKKSLELLRNIIAREIIFPEFARGMSPGSTSFDFYAKINKTKGVFEMTGQPENGEEVLHAEEVVITSLPDENMEKESVSEYRKIFMKEINRVLQELPVNFPELEGKYVKFNIKFAIQD